jgi:hypothetical protein
MKSFKENSSEFLLRNQKDRLISEYLIKDETEEMIKKLKDHSLKEKLILVVRWEESQSGSSSSVYEEKLKWYAPFNGTTMRMVHEGLAL